MRSNLKYVPKEIFIPKREIVKMGYRWIIYLPQEYDELWRILKEQGRKVRVYIEVIDEDES
uniref:Uncharacterized protein n=1 Tax=Ignisphaera aggregans TaxID=334771 RepID=A0A7J3Z752_9CREN